MIEWHPVPSNVVFKAKTDGLALFEWKKKKICIAYHQGSWFALHNRCTHSGGPLSEGWIQDDCVVCPWHRYAFQLHTGQAERGGFYVETFPIKEENQTVFLGIKRKKSRWSFM